MRELGDRLQESLRDLPGVLAVRGRGLMIAADIPASAPEVARRALLEQRLVIHATGPQTLRFLPPLIIEEAHVDEAVRRLAPLLAGGSAQSRLSGGARAVSGRRPPGAPRPRSAGPP